MKIKIPYKPREWAKQLHECTKRWMVLVLHRRAGKTVAVVNHLQRDALKIPGSKYAYIAPTYKQAKLIAWEIFKKYSACVPGVEYNESELSIKYPNGSKIYLFGSENVDALRGISLWGGCQDESSQQPSNLFSEVISKCLADHLGYWIWLGTPKGKNQFFKTYTNARGSEDHMAILRTIDDTLRDEVGETVTNLGHALEDDRKLVALGEMTQEEFDQEWYCSFEAAIKGAYYARELAQARRDGRIKIVPYDPMLPVFDVWDLGVGQKLAIGLYQRFGSELRMIDYWEGSNNDGIPQAIKALKEKPYIYGKHFAPHDIRHTDVGTGKTRLETAEALQWKFEVVPSMKVDDGINAGKLFFSRLWIDEQRCAHWLDAMAQYRQEWDESKGMFKEKPEHDWTSHPADVHRYAALVEKEMINEKPITTAPVQPWEPSSEYEGSFETQWQPTSTYEGS